MKELSWAGGKNMKEWSCKGNAGVEWGRRGEYEEVEK
jgi:hypothetical protein